MTQPVDSQKETIADALARRVEARPGGTPRWAEAFRELAAVDRAVYDAVARTPTPELDRPVRRLSDAANNSRLWLGIAAAIALVGGGRGRRAALEGVVAIGVTSATVNREARRQQAASGSLRPRPRCGSPRADAGIGLISLRARRVGLRIRLRRRPAPAGAWPADPTARGRGGILPRPHRRALPGRRRGRLHSRSRDSSHGGRGKRPPVAATAGPPPVCRPGNT